VGSEFFGRVGSGWSLGGDLFEDEKIGGESRFVTIVYTLRFTPLFYKR
jgi:hypothetical protein